MVLLRSEVLYLEDNGIEIHIVVKSYYYFVEIS